MLHVERCSGSHILIHANGWLSAADYDRFETAFADELVRWTLPVPLLLDMRRFRGWTLPGFVRDLQWDIRHRNAFSKIAVVGNARWHKWITAAGRLLFRGQLKYFPATDVQRAEQWLAEAASRA